MNQHIPTPHATTHPSIAEIAASIRRIRKSKNWTLRDVEEKSEGKWKAVVVGSYERCDRALSLNKAIGLASFYGVPLDELLGLHSEKTETNNFRTEQQRLVIDLRSLAALSFQDQNTDSFKRFIYFITSRRRDWNGEVLSLRTGDLALMGILLGKNEGDVYQWTIDKGLLLGIPR